MLPIVTKCRTNSSRRAPTPSARPANTATNLTMVGALSRFDQSVPYSAASEAGGSAAGVTAPMHGQIAVHPRTGATTRRLVMTAPPPSFRTENLRKRSRGGNRTPAFVSSDAVPVRNPTGLVKGRVDSGNDHRSDSIPSKSRRISDPDVEPVVASQLSVRTRDSSAVGLAVQCEDVSGDFLTQGVGGGEVDRGAQAVCGQPLVPRPSSPRFQGECHPW